MKSRTSRAREIPMLVCPRRPLFLHCAVRNQATHGYPTTASRESLPRTGRGSSRLAGQPDRTRRARKGGWARFLQNLPLTATGCHLARTTCTTDSTARFPISGACRPACGPRGALSPKPAIDCHRLPCRAAHPVRPFEPLNSRFAEHAVQLAGPGARSLQNLPLTATGCRAARHTRYDRFSRSIRAFRRLPASLKPAGRALSKTCHLVPPIAISRRKSGATVSTPSIRNSPNVPAGLGPGAEHREWGPEDTR
jgi:hypothetical protein